MGIQRYDYLLVGSGLFNAIFAFEASKDGKKCLVVEKRSHTGGNLYCEYIDNIIVHKYGPHIFHTKSKPIWEYMKQFCEFSNFVYRPLACYKNDLYNLPFNMNTFYQLWRTRFPKDAMKMINSQKIVIDTPLNAEEQALSLVGTDIYNKLIKGYTEKQWGIDAKELPAFIIKRLPLRFTFDNNYFNDPYQGIPIVGYNIIFDKCFQSADVILNFNYLCNRSIALEAKKIIYTGTIDEYYNYCFGQLEYRSLKFESELLNTPNFQGNAVINYTEREIPYTRILEHKHFERDNQSNKTIITREYPLKWSVGEEPYYPVNTDRNNKLYRKYLNKSEQEQQVIFAGRLGSFSYYDMDLTVEKALSLYKQVKSS